MLCSSYAATHANSAALTRLCEVPLDRQTIAQERLNIEGKVRSNLFPWNGQFSPQLVHALLETYGPPNGSILDPFMGSGTVLIEAARLGQRPFGCEINPAAFAMAQTYTFVNDDRESRHRTIAELDAVLCEAFDLTPLFSRNNERPAHASIQAKLLSIWRQYRAPSREACLLEALIVLLDAQRNALSTERVLAIWRKLSRTVLDLPFSPQPVAVSNCDARQLPLGAATVDLVLTSPPYINVFNYHQQYRAPAEAMGWDLLHVARSEIGSNRKHRGNRFLTVIQYCLDMAQSLGEMRRVCKPDGRIIVVVGRESNVRKTTFYNGDIVTRVAERCSGLSPESRQERVFTNRFGQSIYEDILHFRPCDRPTGAPATAADIGMKALEMARGYCPSESLNDLHDALSRAAAVKSSPLYRIATLRPRGSNEAAHATS